MEIEINALTRQNIIVAATAALLALVTVMALLGRAVTPVDAGMAVLLTSARWQEYSLARQARGEAALLQQDARDLQALLAAKHLEPVAAQLLAQRIYANHQAPGDGRHPARSEGFDRGGPRCGVGCRRVRARCASH